MKKNETNKFSQVLIKVALIGAKRPYLQPSSSDYNLGGLQLPCVVVISIDSKVHSEVQRVYTKFQEVSHFIVFDRTLQQFTNTKLRDMPN